MGSCRRPGKDARPRSLRVDGKGFDGRSVRKGEGLPIAAVIAKQPVVVGEIQDAIFLLANVPGFDSGMEIRPGIAADVRETHRRLAARGPPTQGKAKKEEEDPFHSGTS